jgi:hypothetical protein
MKKTITIQDMRHAIIHVNIRNVSGITDFENVSDEQLLNCDFARDLNIGNILLANVITELQKKNHNVHLPLEICKIVPDKRVKSLLDTINQYIKEAEALEYMNGYRA